MDKAFSVRDLFLAVLFFVPCGWLLVETLLGLPDTVPNLWPIVPMLVSAVWYRTME
ncbi:MAG: hypothetical protein AAF438_05170 [Pseudomonadota bacterium]